MHDATKIVQSERICKKNKDFLLNMKKKAIRHYEGFGNWGWQECDGLRMGDSTNKVVSAGRFPFQPVTRYSTFFEGLITEMRIVFADRV